MIRNTHTCVCVYSGTGVCIAPLPRHPRPCKPKYSTLSIRNLKALGVLYMHVMYPVLSQFRGILKIAESDY